MNLWQCFPYENNIIRLDQRKFKLFNEVNILRRNINEYTLIVYVITLYLLLEKIAKAHKSQYNRDN